MSDETSVTFNGASIRESDVIRFLSEVAPKNACPLCATSAWSLLMAPSPGVYVQVVAGDTGGNLSEHMPVYLTLCSHCGYMRHHAYGPVQTWLSKQEAGHE